MPETPYLIGIAGASCSGKTSLANRVAELVSAPAARVISLDSYYRDLSHFPPEQRATWNFDLPAAQDKDLLHTQLRALLRGESVEIPVYDFATHARAAATERVEPASFIIIEGLFVLFWEEVRALLDTKVFIEVADAVCLARRIARDVRERGRTEESVRTQYAITVRPMYARYCIPTARFADIVVNGEDPVETSAAAVLEHVGIRRNGR